MSRFFMSLSAGFTLFGLAGLTELTRLARADTKKLGKTEMTEFLYNYGFGVEIVFLLVFYGGLQLIMNPRKKKDSKKSPLT